MAQILEPELPARGRLARVIGGPYFGWVVAGILLLGVLIPDDRYSLIAVAFGASLAGILLFARIRENMSWSSKDLGGINALIAHDDRPVFVVRADGEILVKNAKAAERFGRASRDSFEQVLEQEFSSAGAIIFRLQAKASRQNASREDVVTRSGRFRVSVHRLQDDSFLWAIEENDLPPQAGRVADRISMPMATVGTSGAILFMNAALRRLVGGRVKTVDRLFAAVPENSGEITELSGKDGAIEVQALMIPGAAGKTEYYLAPIVGAEKSSAPLRELEDFPVALLRLSPDGKTQQANRLARDLLSLEKSSGDNLADLIDGLGRPLTDWLAEAAEGKSLHKPEVLRTTNAGDEIYLQVSLGRVIEDGQVSLIAMINDATELKSLEAQFVQGQKMQAIGQLAGGVAHDFNNLLTAISGHCDLLMLRYDPDDPDYADLDQINQNANRAASLVGQLLAFSRKQNLQLEVLDMRDTLADLTHLLNRLVGAQISLSLTHDPKLMPVHADRRQIEQVIMNLVVNARDAMDGNGEIKIETRNAKLQSDLERDRVVVPRGDYVLVKVSDNGSGIPKDKLSKVFEPFFTTKKTGEGTGLGLSTAYGIVKQSGGFIFVDSEIGKGTEFSIFFPTFDRPALEPAPVVEEHVDVEYGPIDAVVLLVEDEAPVRAFASRALKMRGFEVIEAANAEEALETLEDTSISVDLVVSDVVMPGLDGPSWVKIARETRPDLKVVFVSGYAEDHLTKDKEQLPNSVFLPKPFSLNQLANVVRGQLSDAA